MKQDFWSILRAVGRCARKPCEASLPWPSGPRPHHVSALRPAKFALGTGSLDLSVYLADSAGTAFSGYSLSHESALNLMDMRCCFLCSPCVSFLRPLPETVCPPLESCLTGGQRVRSEQADDIARRKTACTVIRATETRQRAGNDSTPFKEAAGKSVKLLKGNKILNQRCLMGSMGKQGVQKP